MASGFKEVARLDEVPDGGTKQVVVEGALVGLFRTGDDVYAIGDVCTHQEAFLKIGRAHV